MSSIAFVRPVPESFPHAVTVVPAEPPLDVERARAQHTGYAAALEQSGYTVVSIPVADDHPDSAFVEDTAVVVGEQALITRPGHPSRRDEVEIVAGVLGEHFELHRMSEPAMLDGGDVLVVGRRVLVGLSDRTNLQGFAAAAAVVESQGFSVEAVEVGDVLHLKSGLSAIDDTTVLWHAAACHRSALSGLEVIEVGGDDPEAANVVRLADGGILASTQHQATAELVEGHGCVVRRCEVSEFARADGGLTCLSIRVR